MPENFSFNRKQVFKMLLRQNILQSVTINSCFGSLICIGLHYLANVSPITGIFFPIYVIIMFIVSIAISFKFIQWVLHLNNPIKYDFEGILRIFPLMKRVLPVSYFERPAEKVLVEDKDYDCNQLAVIASVLEKKLVSSWYASYISEEISFPFACKQLLDQMIGKSFQICEKIETKDIYVDMCSIIVSHLKEYRKAVKREEKSTGPIEIHYKKSHPVFTNIQKDLTSGEHCTNVLRLLAKDVAPWELWDTSQSELLVRILSKKLDDFINTTLSNPQWIYNQLYTLLNNKEDISKSNIKMDIIEKETPNINETTETPKIQTEIIEPIVENVESPIIESDKEILEDIPEIITSGAVDINSSPRLRQKRGRRRDNEVKIYDRIIEGSVKTWDTHGDLQCISLGQDLLESLDKDIALSRLWEQDSNEVTEGWSPNPQAQSRSPQPLWFGEDDIELEGILPQFDSKKMESPKKDGSPNPADVLLKDLQFTVTQAKHKIGDLQVDVVQRKLSTDEAAGMMEGLLDFGIAGLKKGLRFTGLHDTQMKERSVSPDESRFKIGELDIDTTRDVMEKDDEHAVVVPPLTKQSRVTSQDSMWQSRTSEISHSSPEPEYEDSADLSSSIAKLRSLLHQEHTPVHPQVSTWAAAEETRGRTHHYPCSKPVDAAALADEYDMTSDRLSPEQSNNMQRLDKVFSRTVTGVFNSLRTVVRDEHADVPRNVTYKMAAEPPTERDLSYAMARLLGSIRPGAVDAAFDSLHHLNPVPKETHTSQDTFDYDEWCSSLGARASSTLEVCNAVGLCHSHVALRLANLLVADVAEALISAWLKELTVWLKSQVLATFTELSKQPTAPVTAEDLKISKEEVCALIMDKMPSCLYVFGEEAVKQSVSLVVCSVSNERINADLSLRVLDVAALHFKRAATFRNSSFDIN